MELNMISAGIELIGTTIKTINVDNDIVDIEKEAKRNFGLNINEPIFQQVENGIFAQMTIDFGIEVIQSTNQKCKIELSLEGAFISNSSIKEETFEQLVAVNGAAAIIGIARGKIETLTANIFNNGKVVIPFVNVVDYYKSVSEMLEAE